MPINYRQWAYRLSPPVLKTMPGRAIEGIKALLHDFLMLAAVHAVRTGWVGDTVGPSYDGIGPAGVDMLLPRYPGETFNAYHKRLQRAWEDWPRAGTEQILIDNLAALGFPGAQIRYHTSWDGYPAPWWSLFSIFYAHGTHTVGPPKKWGEFTWGDGTIYGVTNITPIQLVTLKGIVRKFKPAHWVCVGIVFEMSAGGDRVVLGLD